MNELAPASPCINVCVLDADTDICRGCYRTLAEIAGWSAFSAAEKRAILRKIEERRRVPPPRLRRC